MTATTNGAVLEHELGASGRFHLRQPAGSVVVRGVDGTTARVRELHGRNLSETFQIEAAAGELALVAPERFGLDLVFGIGRRSSVDVEVEVPRTASISIETASADIRAIGLESALKVRTASGEIAIDDIAGRLELDAVSGDARVTASGALDLKARTISGDLAVRGPSLSRAEIGTTSGDARLDAAFDGPGPFGVETVSGDVAIVGRTGLRIEARTVTGELRSELPHRRDSGPGRKQLIVGDGGVPFVFRSVSGDLRVVAPREDLPAAPSRPDRPATPVVPARPAAPAAPAAPMAPVAPSAPSASPARSSQAANEDGREVARLDILRALERGELSVEAAMRRLAEIEEA